MDITYCSQTKCTHLDCIRHQIYAPKDKNINIADLNDGWCFDPVKSTRKEPTKREKLREMLKTPIMAAPAVACTNCLICGSEIAVDLCENHTKVCDDCKKAIKFIKEHFRYED
jgi:hypothetical protein